MRIAIGYDQEGWLHKEYINYPIVPVVKKKQVGFGTSITENKYCEIRAVIACMPDLSFSARAHNNTISIRAL